MYAIGRTDQVSSDHMISILLLIEDFHNPKLSVGLLSVKLPLLQLKHLMKQST